MIRPQPLRPRRRPKAIAIQPFYLDLAVFIFSSRYVTLSQCLRRFPEQLRGQRTAQRHLTNMVDHGLIAVASTRGVSPNFPFAYFVTGRGVRFIKEQIPNGGALQIPVTEERRTRGQSLHSLLHELMITEFGVMLEQTARSRGDLQILSQERRYFRKANRLTYQAEGKRARIEPDLGFLPALVGEQGERRVLPLHFVEMELGTHRVSSLRDKLLAYDRWAATEWREYFATVYASPGEQITNAEFRLLLIACDAYGAMGDLRRLLDLLLQAIELPAKMRNRIWICTAAAARDQAREVAPLAAPIWIRAKDAKSWLPRYREFASTDSRGDRKGAGSYAHRRKFIATHLAALPRHALFPRVRVN